ncbi:MAG: hypothetical protein AB7K68_09625 [Bacteriovoracia bacterium]
MSRTFITEQGTELPLLNLKGKDYLEVKYRLVWFREEHPQWSIETEFLSMDDRSACARAVVRDETGRIIATSHKAETAGNFPDFMEKAETGAIGRALALIGFGTQFCADELDEGDRIVDAPVAKKSDYQIPPSVGLARMASDREFSLGDFEVKFGKKYFGKRLKDIPRAEIESYVDWLETNAKQKMTGPSYELTLLKEAVDRFHHPEKYKAPVKEEKVAKKEEKPAKKEEKAVVAKETNAVV